MSEAGKAWGLIAAILAAFALACLFAFSAGVAAGRDAVAPSPIEQGEPPAPSPRAALCDETFDRMRDIILDEEQAAADQESAVRIGGGSVENP